MGSGSDGDVTIIDTNFKRKVTMGGFHIAEYGIWKGFEADGWPVTTILRGNVVVDNREFKAAPGSGQFIPRKVDAAITNSPKA